METERLLCNKPSEELQNLKATHTVTVSIILAAATIMSLHPTPHPYLTWLPW